MKLHLFGMLLALSTVTTSAFSNTGETPKVSQGDIKTIKVGDKVENITFKAYDSIGKDKGYLKDKTLESGKITVLEWHNAGCPFVKKYYDPKYLQGLHEKYKDNVEWILVLSSAKGNPGYMDLSKEEDRKKLEEYKNIKAIIIDADGHLGRMFDVKDTPTVAIINKDSLLSYHGAVTGGDGKEFNEKAPPYLALALNTLLSKPTEGTEAHGCSVKYAS